MSGVKAAHLVSRHRDLCRKRQHCAPMCSELDEIASEPKRIARKEDK